MAYGATSVYQLAAAFGDPQTSRAAPTAGDKTKWLAYKQGRHTPSDELVRRVEERCPGSTGVLRHALWSSLALKDLTLGGVTSVLVRLRPEIYAITWRCMTKGTGQLCLADGWDDIRIAMLERRDGLDALAALVVAARWAKASGQERSAFNLCGAICRRLLVLGPWLYRHGIARPLVEFVEQTVLAHGAWDGRRHKFWSLGYMGGLWSLRLAVEDIGGLSRCASEEDQFRALRKLVGDGRGGGLSRLVVVTG